MPVIKRYVLRALQADWKIPALSGMSASVS